jgi:hypothetical protein
MSSPTVLDIVVVAHYDPPVLFALQAIWLLVISMPRLIYQNTRLLQLLLPRRSAPCFGWMQPIALSRLLISFLLFVLVEGRICSS